MTLKECYAALGGDYDDVLTGMCQNLSFTVLGQSSHDLTEALRGGKKPEADELFARVRADYQRTVETIEAFRAAL